MKTKSTSSLKKKAWNTFSLWIRTKYADWKGYVACVTCGVTKPIKAMQAGHFIAGRMNSILFDERGVHPQCYSCNIGKHGNTLEYLDFMKKKYGMKVVNELRTNSRKPRSWKTGELEELIERYKI